MDKPRTITVMTHQYPEETSEAIRRLIDFAVSEGVAGAALGRRGSKHQLSRAKGSVLGADVDGETDLAVVLGGDGTILTALRTFAGRKAPVFAINYGAIGFLSTIDHGGLEDGMRRALSR